jgi:hypothetical protein
MAMSQEAVQENPTRASHKNRGAESTLTGREIAKPVPLAIVPSAERIARVPIRGYRGFAGFRIGRFPTAAGRVETLGLYRQCGNSVQELQRQRPPVGADFVIVARRRWSQ